MKVTIPAGVIIRKETAPNCIGIRYPKEYELAVRALLESADKKKITQLCWELSLPHRPRSTGPRSQNSRIHGNCKDIADQLTDYTPEQVKDAMKRMAVGEGYPTVLTLDGIEEGKPTRDSSIEEAKIILDVIQRFADTHGLYLTEYDDDGPYQTVGGRPRNEMRACIEQDE